MAYISLYRKYRPDSFDKVIGQDHIVRTLVNQIKNKTVSHAYLFTGTRGTGKTTVARVFAKAVNCLNPVNGSPCGKCVSCTELSQVSSMDISELDAASNNSVDDIRELCDKTVYSPAVVKYKVFIIDEVHMLSGSAFNALLKTLEEPPAHVIFILATTDVHKLPQTILSRCMRFDFRLVGGELLAANIKAIFDDMSVTYEEPALRLIASAAEGSVRDSLSLADKCAAFDKNVTYEKVLEVLGASNPHQITALIKNIAEGDSGGALAAVSKAAALGKNMASLAKDTSAALGNILYIKNCGADDIILGVPRPVYEELLPLSKAMSNAKILFVLDLLNGLAAELKYTTQPRILLEAALVRACTEADNSLSGLQQRVKELEAKVSALSAEKKTLAVGIKGAEEACAPLKAQSVPPQPMPATATAVMDEAGNADEDKAQSEELINYDALWKKLWFTLLERKYVLLGGTLSNLSPRPTFEGNYLPLPVSDFNTRNLFNNADNRRLIASVLKEVTGKDFNVGAVACEQSDEAPSEKEEALKTIFGDRLKIVRPAGVKN